MLVVPFLFVRDAVLPQGVSAPLTLRTLIAGFWISPRAFPDFGWTLGSRVLVNIGNALGTSLLLFFLIYGLGRPALDAEGDLLLLTLVYMVASIIASIVCGRWSDVLGRRKVFVLSSALLQASGAVLLIVWPQFEPDATSRGKDLGIMNIASAVPQALAPMLGALVVSAVGGFEGLFVASAVFSTAGALMILGVKGVR